MQDNENNDDTPKKAITRKKLVDLKAVAALLEENDTPDHPGMHYHPDEDLIQATARIKSQRDLIDQRVQKMLQNRNRVSKNVFDKVYRDYQMQLESVGKLLGEKKALLKDELKNLYLFREKQQLEMNRHKEILEEAQFRHYLEEFTEEQYKEVEDFESKEIHSLQNELNKTNSYIKLYEELFDSGDLSKKETRPKAPPPEPVTKTFHETPKPEVAKPIPQAPPRPAPPSFQDLSEKTPVPELIREGEAVADEAGFESSLNPNIQIQVEKAAAEGDYFQVEEPAVLEEKPVKIDTGKTVIHSSGETASPPSEPDSIFDILEDIPDSQSAQEKVFTSSITPTPMQSVISASTSQAPASQNYKLIFTEVENPVESNEFPLKENVSIGRSPSNDLVLKAPKVSRQHAAINKYKDQYLLIDLKSSNGVYVNGRKIDEYALQEGDEIAIGGYKMVFQKN